MTEERYKELNGPEINASFITPQEQAEGWHWCHDFDLLLVGPGMGELEFCSCLEKDHPVYKTIPSCSPTEPAIDFPQSSDQGKESNHQVPGPY